MTSRSCCWIKLIIIIIISVNCQVGWRASDEWVSMCWRHCVAVLRGDRGLCVQQSDQVRSAPLWLLCRKRHVHYKMNSGVYPSVRPSVCSVPRPNSRTERPKKPKIGKMEVHRTSNRWTYLEVKRSKFKVTRSINVHTVNAQYLLNGKAYELQT